MKQKQRIMASNNNMALHTSLLQGYACYYMVDAIILHNSIIKRCREGLRMLLLLDAIILCLASYCSLFLMPAFVCIQHPCFYIVFGTVISLHHLTLLLRVVRAPF